MSEVAVMPESYNLSHELGEVSNENTESKLRSIARNLSSRRFPKHPDSDVYIGGIAQKIGAEFPYSNEGLGVGTIDKQLKDTEYAHDESKTDCKLPAAILGFTLDEMKRNGDLAGVKGVDFVIWGVSTHPRVQVTFDRNEDRIVWYDFKPKSLKSSLPVAYVPNEKDMVGFERYNGKVLPVNLEGLKALDERFIEQISKESQDEAAV